MKPNMKRMFISILLLASSIMMAPGVNAAVQCNAMLAIDNMADGAKIDPALLAKMLGRTPLTFIPFVAQDIVAWIDYFNINSNPQPQAPKIGDRTVAMTTTNTIELREYKYTDFGSPGWVMYSDVGTVTELLQDLNKFEQEMNALGYSIRTTDNDSIFSDVEALYTDQKKLKAQMLHDLKVAATTQLLECAATIPVANCPQFDLQYAQTHLVDTVERIEVLPDGTQKKIVESVTQIDPNKKVDINGNEVTLSTLINAANSSAKVACLLNIKLFDLIPGFQAVSMPGIDHPVISWNLPTLSLPNFGKMTFAGMSSKLQALGCPKFLCGALAKVGFGGSGPSKWWENYIDFDFADFNSPEALKLKAIQNTLSGLSTNFDIPNLSKMPVLDPPTYPKLQLKKKKEWSGINRGSHDRVGIESLAYYEIYGSELAQAGVAYGKFSAWILGLEINIVSASGDFFTGVASESNNIGLGLTSVDPSDILGYMAIKLRYFGDTWESIQNQSGGLGISVNRDEPPISFKFIMGNSYQFTVGPVPVVVTIGGYFEAGLDWSAGLGPFKMYAMLEPFAKGGGFVQGGAGIGKFSAGVGGELTIIDARVPLEAAVRLAFSENGEPYLDLGISSKPYYITLGGRIYAYVTYPWPKFSWRPGWKTKQKTKTLFETPGELHDYPIFDWGMEVGYRGLTMRGDLIDQQDLAMAAMLQGSIDIFNRADALSSYLSKTNLRLVNFYTKLGQDLAAETTNVPVVTSTVVAASDAFLLELDTYNCHLSTIAGTPCL
ncbi:MAG: hypothetical protein ACC707_00270 [Thiohalomonadales bacterium]